MALVTTLLSDEALMKAMLTAGGPRDGKYGQAMQIYTAIQKASPRAKDGMFQRLALATSLEHAVPIDTACGIYFLISEKRIVYVGQSTNVFSRVYTHMQTKQFDSYVYMPCEKDMLDKLESLYIHFLTPELNGNFHNGNKIAPLSLNEILK